MRRIILGILSALFTFGCSSIDCPVQNTVYTVYNIYGVEGADTLYDTLSVWTQRRDGTDTLVLNRGVGLTTFTLPISYAQPEDTFFFRVGDTTGLVTIDTVWIKKDNFPHFESVDCNPSYFHHLTAVRSTHYGIESISIYHPTVNYDPSTEHFHIYFKER